MELIFFSLSSSLLFSPLTHRLEDGHARIPAPRDRVVTHDGVVTGAMEHDASVQVVVHHVVLDADIVAPLRGNDPVVTFMVDSKKKKSRQQARFFFCF